MEKIIALACDHGGFSLKEEIKKHFDEKGIRYIDLGCDSEKSVDYPVYAAKLCENLLSGGATLGILCCGTRRTSLTGSARRALPTRSA